jgi:hypothetical protein
MLREVHIKLSDYAHYLARVSRVKLPAAIDRGLMSGALRCVAVMQKKTDEAKVFNIGVYKRSWKAIKIAGGARVYNDTPYAAVIELGRRPGARMPPSSVLAHWAQRKLGLSAAEAKSAGFVIARAIARRGLPARLVLTKAMPELERVVKEEVVRELATAF